MAFSVQFATEFTSAAAPRTVLHADMAIDPPIIAIVITLRSMLLSPVVTPNPTRNSTKPLHCATGIFQPLNDGGRLDRNRRRNMRVRIVVLEDEILGLVAVDRLAAVLEHQARQRTRVAAQFQPRLL